MSGLHVARRPSHLERRNFDLPTVIEPNDAPVVVVELVLWVLAEDDAGAPYPSSGPGTSNVAESGELVSRFIAAS